MSDPRLGAWEAALDEGWRLPCDMRVLPGSAHRRDADGDGRPEVYFGVESEFGRMLAVDWVSTVPGEAIVFRVHDGVGQGRAVVVADATDEEVRLARAFFGRGQLPADAQCTREPPAHAQACGHPCPYSVRRGQVNYLLEGRGWEQCQGHDDRLWRVRADGTRHFRGGAIVDVFEGHQPGEPLRLTPRASHLLDLHHGLGWGTDWRFHHPLGLAEGDRALGALVRRTLAAWLAP